MDLFIREVNADNWDEVAMLSVNEDQKEFIESNAYSLAQSKFEAGWTAVGLYDGEALIGFAMYGLHKQTGRVWLDRFMIDKQFQGRGYGKKAMQCLLDHIQAVYQPKTIYLSIFKENKHAQTLYEKFGFRFNGEIDIGGELVMELPMLAAK